MLRYPLARAKSLLVVFAFSFAFVASISAQASPRLNFTDLANGPDVGLGDGKGSGVIVTLWGQNLGGSQGSSKAYFTDSQGVRREVAHYYYWKNADGQAPGGPANLYESHLMQEVAVSIPDSAAGNGSLTLVVNGEESNALPFLVRSGSIYHVSPGGSNSNPGTYAQPWRSVSQNSGGALAKNLAGDVIYSHGVVDAETTQTTQYYGVGMYSNRAPGTLFNQTAIASYPGYQSRIEGYHFGFDVDNTKAFVLSKYKVLTGNHVEPAQSSNTPLSITATVSAGIQGTAHGRVVGNYVGDLVGRCVSSMSGGIVANHNGGYDYVSELKVYGNHIDSYGCKQTSRYQHTTYFSNRWAATLEPFELGWNYLNNNMADGGLYIYDERGNGQPRCGDWTAAIRIHNNVVANQRGAAVVIGTNGGAPCWTNDILVYNNLFKNTGAGPNLLETNVNIGASAFWFWGGSYTGTARIYNNTLVGFSDPSFSHGPRAAIGLSGWGDGNKISFENNVVVKTAANSKWVDVTSSNYGPALLDDISGSHNLFYEQTGSSAEALPGWSANSLASNPGLQQDGVQRYQVLSHSAIVNSGLLNDLTHDLYGNRRIAKTMGAIVPTPAQLSLPVAPRLSVE